MKFKNSAAHQILKSFSKFQFRRVDSVVHSLENKLEKVSDPIEIEIKKDRVGTAENVQANIKGTLKLAVAR